MNRKNFTFQGLIIALIIAAPNLLQGQIETFMTKQGSTNSVSQCSGFFYDDGGNNAPYADASGALTDVITLCPSTPSGQVISVEFQLFDVAPGDRMLAFDGPNNTAAPIIASSQGSGTGPSVADAPGGGTVEASCKNITGCITFAFLRNGDNVKGAGFKASVTCKNRSGNVLDCSLINTFNGSTGQFFTVADCSTGKQKIKIPIPRYTDCGTVGTLKVSSSCQVGLPVSVSGTGQGFLEAEFPIGNHTVTFTTAAYSDKKCTASIRVIAPNLVCNDNVNVSLSNECVVILTPDLIAEGICEAATIVRPADGASIPVFSYEVALVNSQNINLLGSTIEGYPIIDFGNALCGSSYEVKVTKKYIYDADCDGKLFNGTSLDDTPLTTQCSGRIIIKDKEPPIVTQGPAPVAIPCYDKKVNNKDIIVTLNNIDPNKKGLGGSITLPLTNATINVPGKESLVIIENCHQDITTSAWEFVTADCTDSEYITDWNNNSYNASVFGYYRRTFFVKDRCGNEAQQVQRIWVYQPAIVAAIPDYNVSCNVDIHPTALRNNWLEWVNASRPANDIRQSYGAFLPNFDPTFTDFTLYPLTNGSGDEIPLDVEGSDCGYTVDWMDSDSIFTCGGSFNVFRTWTVYDWCDGILQLTNIIPQVINVGDKEGPIILGELTHQVSGNALQDCTSDVTFTRPQVSDDCGGAVKVYIRYENQEKEFTSNTATLEGLPIGQSVTIELIATDACNNKTIQSKNYLFKDQIAPTAICETKHTVSIGFDCTVVVPADVFDDGSFDNCGQVSYSIARLNADGSLPTDQSYKDQIILTSRDLTSDCTSAIKVAFRVKDASGNINNCISEINLQDKLAPVGQSLTETISCEQELSTQLQALKAENSIPARLAAFSNLINTDSSIGNINATDNCTQTSQLKIQVLDVNFNNLDATCKHGNIEYLYQLIDRCGNISSIYNGTINLQPKTDWELHLPADIQYYCDGQEATVPTPSTLDQILINNGCDAWGMEVQTARFDDVPDACYKIINTYRFINWCTWNPNHTEIAIIERPDTLLPANYQISLRYKDNDQNGINDINDGDEDADGNYIYAPEGPFKINDVDEAINYDPYDITPLLNDGDFVVIDRNDAPYQGIVTYNAVSQFTKTTQTYLSAQAYGNIQYRQIIKIHDNTAPSINLTPYQPFCGGDQQTASNQPCTAKADIHFTVSDACTNTTDIKVTYTLKPFGQNPTNDPFGNLIAQANGQYTISGQYPLAADGKPAQHTFVITVQDGCNNTKVVEATIQVKDCKAPLTYCISGLSATMSSQGTVTLPISSFDRGSLDYCTPRSSLRFTFADPNIHPDSTTRTFQCANQEIGAVPVTLWTQDLAGNTSQCETLVSIAPYSDTNCTPTPSAQIAGRILTEDNRYLQSIQVQLSGAAEEMEITQNDGSYLFQSVELGYDYTITPYSDTNAINGIPCWAILSS